MKRPEKGLTDRERLFVESYIIENCNGMRAARRAGYGGGENGQKVRASQLLHRPRVRAYLDELRKQSAVDALETMSRVGEHIRASFADILNDQNQIDLEKARQQGKLHLITEITEDIVRTIPGTEISPPAQVIRRRVKIVSSQEALKMNMRALGLEKVPVMLSQDKLDEALATLMVQTGKTLEELSKLTK